MYNDLLPNTFSSTAYMTFHLYVRISLLAHISCVLRSNELLCIVFQPLVISRSDFNIARIKHVVASLTLTLYPYLIIGIYKG